MIIKVVEEFEHTTLIQTVDDQGHVNRYVLPSGEVEVGEDGVVFTTLDPIEGVQWGIPWEEILEIDLTVEDLAHEFRRRGLWTYDDLVTRHPDLQAAILKSSGMSAANIRTAVLKFMEGNTDG